VNASVVDSSLALVFSFGLFHRQNSELPMTGFRGNAWNAGSTTAPGRQFDA